MMLSSPLVCVLRQRVRKCELHFESYNLSFFAFLVIFMTLKGTFCGASLFKDEMCEDSCSKKSSCLATRLYSAESLVAMVIHNFCMKQKGEGQQTTAL